MLNTKLLSLNLNRFYFNTSKSTIMLENLMNLVRKYAGDGINNNSAIPNDKNEQAVQSAGSSIMSTLQNALSGGRISDVLSYFKNGDQTDHPIVNEAATNYAQDLQKNLGLNPQDAQDAANKVIPQTMNQLASQTADPSNKSFNIQDIFNKLSGGKTGSMDIQGMLNKFGGGKLDQDHDGDVDLQDLKAMFSGGDILGKVKGLFS